MTSETKDSALPVDHGQGDEGMAEAVIGDGHLIRVRIPSDYDAPAEIQIWRPDAAEGVRIPVSVLEAEALFQCLIETVG